MIAPILPATSSVIWVITGVGGAVRSGAVAVVPGPVLPLLSVALASTVSPSVNAGVNATVKLPLISAIASPRSLPSLSLIWTVLPGSAVPLTEVPSTATSTFSGAAGAVVSTIVGAVADEPGLLLPAGSVATAVSVSPVVWLGNSGTVKLPSPSACASPSLLPLLSVMVTVLPGSAVPLTEVPFSATKTFSGAAGAVVSGAMTLLPALVLPALSVAVAVSVSPFVCAGVMVMVKLPLPFAIASPSVLPLLSFMVTMLPASAFPLTEVPFPDTTTFSGAAGAVVSGAVIPVGVPIFPAGSVAIIVSISPFV